MSAVQNYFVTAMKAAFITLLPKVGNPLSPKDCRPISLCNFTHKIIAKLLVARHKIALPKLVSEKQGAFVKGQSISDNILTVQEIMHSFRYSTKGNNRVAAKIHTERAYNRMDWSFIETVLLRFGFDEWFVARVMGCVREPRIHGAHQ